MNALNEKFIGKRVGRWKGEEKATGSARYLADIKLKNALVGKVLFSPHAHARIKRIDTSKAEKLDGVFAVVTHADMPKAPYNPNKLNYLIANPFFEVRDTHGISDKARYVGDRIAAVAAVDEETAQKAIELIEVDYEVLPPVFDAVEAIKPGAPLVHDAAANNIPFALEYPGGRGDVEKGFAEADVIIEERFSTARNQISQFEPTACAVDIDSNGHLDIWSPSQHPFLHRSKLAEYFGIPEGQINWHTPHLGGGFGKGGSLSIEPVCVALARKAQRPIKMVYSRQEDFFGTETRQRFIVDAKIGFKKDGTITAIDEKILTDGGAYFSHNGSTTFVHLHAFLDFYRCENTRAQIRCVYTNVPPTGGVRGYGTFEAYTILEPMIDKAARQLGLDPVAIRLKNVKRTGEPSFMGFAMENCTLPKMLEDGAKKIGWTEKKAAAKGSGPRRKGIGVAMMMDVSGAQPICTQERHAYIKFNSDGSINLIVNACDIGQNLPGTLSQIAADVLGLDFDMVHVVNGDTDTALFDTGLHASGGLFQFGNAVKLAAEDAKQKLIKRAARQLEVEPTRLDVADGRVFDRSNPEKSVSVAELAKNSIYNFSGEHEDIVGTGHFSAKDSNPPPYAVVFSEVEVDVETGDVQLQKILYLNDTGVSINPTTVEGQIHGGIMQGIGYCLSEDYIFNEKTGRLITDNFNSYRVPVALDMPQIEVVMYEEADSAGPFGAKAAGHGSIMAVAPSITNAVYDATGICIQDAPITPEKIMRRLRDIA